MVPSSVKSAADPTSSPSTGEDRGEGARLFTPHPSLLPQGEKGSDKGAKVFIGSGFSMEKSMIRARQLRKKMTDAERVLWRELRSRLLADCKFRRQQPLGRYIVDFVCLDKRLVMELDGGQHAEFDQATYDAERTVWLERNGFRVLRFWDQEVLTNVVAVLEAIVQAINLTSSPSTAGD